MECPVNVMCGLMPVVNGCVQFQILITRGRYLLQPSSFDKNIFPKSRIISAFVALLNHQSVGGMISSEPVLHGMASSAF